MERLFGLTIERIVGFCISTFIFGAGFKVAEITYKAISKKMKELKNDIEKPSLDMTCTVKTK